VPLVEGEPDIVCSKDPVELLDTEHELLTYALSVLIDENVYVFEGEWLGLNDTRTLLENDIFDDAVTDILGEREYEYTGDGVDDFNADLLTELLVLTLFDICPLCVIEFVGEIEYVRLFDDVGLGPNDRDPVTESLSMDDIDCVNVYTDDNDGDGEYEFDFV